MSTENALPAVCQRFRELILGAPTTTPHSISAGTFRAIDNTAPLAAQPAGIFHQRPFEVDWEEHTFADVTGPDTLAGNLVDTSATVRVSVGYRMGVGHAINVSDAAAVDARLIRRVLEEPGNYDAASTGLEEVNWLRARKAKPDADGRVVVELLFRVRMREDQPT